MSILNVSIVHLNGIWHLIWRYLSKPVLGGHPVLSGHYSIPRGCPLNTGFTVLKVFLRLVDSFEIIFREEISSALQQKSQKQISSACLFVDIFCLKLAIKCFTFSLQKCKKSREFCCLFTGSWHEGLYFSRYILFYFSVLICVNLHTERVIDHTWLKQRVSVLNTLKQNIVCHCLLQQLNMRMKCVFGHTKHVVISVLFSDHLFLHFLCTSNFHFPLPCLNIPSLSMNRLPQFANY